jgi:hypothetical protein
MSIHLAIDINQALELSQNVCGTTDVPAISGNLTTNASQWEPGEFSNGVNSFGPGNNVFIIHNAGTSAGINQRFAYIGVATETPFTLTRLQAVVSSNASGHSSAHPVVIAVETSPRDDFLSFHTAGTIRTDHESPQTLAMDLRIPSGNTYIRLRSTSPIPDGSNYIAYSNVALDGSVISGAVVASPEPIDPTSGSQMTSTDTFSITYDFKKAAQNAQVVAAAGPAKKRMVSFLGTNASPFEPGEFPNGVGNFGPNHNVFILHNSGAAVGINQRYAYVMISTQVPLVLSQLVLPFGSNATGSSPTNPVVLSVEASPTLDFQDMSILGTVSSANSTCSTTALLPRGSTFIRFRATTQIPDGSNYIAFDNSITLSGSIAKDDWMPIGVRARQVLSYSNMLFVVNNQDGAIWRYSGRPNNWVRIGDAAAQFVGAKGGLYAIGINKDKVWQWNQTTGNWSTIGGPMDSLMIGRHVLHGVDSQGKVWMYSATPNSWTQIGGPFLSVVANDYYCIAIALDGQSVQLLRRGSTAWSTIGGTMSSLVSANNAVYGLDRNGLVFRYSGTPMQWTALGGPFKQLTVQGITLLGITIDGLAVQRLLSDDPLVWTQVGRAMDSICANDRYIAGVRAGDVLLRPRGGTSIQTSAGRRIMRTLDTDDPPPQAPPDSDQNWLFKFHTKDEILAGYDGNIGLLLVRGISQQESHTLPIHHFERNETVLVPMKFEQSHRYITEVHLSGSFHFWPDHWIIDKVVAWDLGNQTMYEFDVDAEVPNWNDSGHWLTLEPQIITPLAPSPTYARVLIWPYLGLNEAIGHAALILSDNMYISWWPSQVNREELMFFGGDYIADAYNNRTYSDDYADEQNAPPYLVIRVYGLDEGAIKTWWKGFNVPGAKYHLLDENCSTVVYKALSKGNVIPDWVKPRVEAIPVWTPEWVGRLAIAIAEKDYREWVGHDDL